jgi:hypothetical protein
LQYIARYPQRVLVIPDDLGAYASTGRSKFKLLASSVGTLDILMLAKTVLRVSVPGMPTATNCKPSVLRAALNPALVPDSALPATIKEL